MRQLVERGVLLTNGGQQAVLPGHTLPSMCVLYNRLGMARLLLREMTEDVHYQSTHAVTLVELCVQHYTCGNCCWTNAVCKYGICMFYKQKFKW